MPIIILQKPLPLDRSECIVYESAGVIFLEPSSEGYTKIQADFSSGEVLQKLSLLPKYYLERLFEAFKDKDFLAKLIKDIDLQKLQNMLKVPDDGYPFPENKRPFAWETTHKLINAELQTLNTRLKSLGIQQTRVGMELEFVLPKDPIEGFDNWQKVRSEILAEINTKIQTLAPVEAEHLIKKRALIEQFNAREILMYDLVERDPNTKNILEPIFGAHRDGDGYYDAEDTLEVKIAHDDITAVSMKRRIVMQTIYKKAAEFGLILENGFTQQLSFSFWKEGKNLFSAKHPQLTTLGKSLAEGVTRFMYDAFPFFIPESSLKYPLDLQFTLHVNRENFLRFASDRIELRPSIGGPTQNLDILLIFVLAGALYSFREQKSLFQATLIKSGSFHHQSGQLKLTSHLLCNSIITADNSLNIPERYLSQKFETICYEMGVIEQKRFEISLYHPLLNFFKKIKIVTRDNEFIIEWPETDKDIYTINVPGMNMHFFPPEIQAQLIRDGYLSKEIIDQYVDPIQSWGMQFSPPKNFVIDVKQLKEKIHLVEVNTKFIIEQPYDTNDLSVHPNLHLSNVQDARLQRLIYSIPLRQILSSSFMDALSLAVKQKSMMSSTANIISTIGTPSSYSPPITTQSPIQKSDCEQTETANVMDQDKKMKDRRCLVM